MDSGSSQWSNLPRDILSAITNLLDLNDDLWRLRSVCSSWRSNLSHLTSTSPDVLFPVEVPKMETSWYRWDHLDRKPRVFLKKATVYCIYPPGGGCGKGNGWMFKVSKTHWDSNLFSLLNPLSTEKMANSIGSLPKTLSRLDYRITEICSSYYLEFLDLSKPQIRAFQLDFVAKTIVLQNYVRGCDFVVMIVTDDGKICYWKRGDVKWTDFEANKDYRFSDVVLYEGKCYAIGNTGILVLIDSYFRVIEVTSAIWRSPAELLLVVGLKSELYLILNNPGFEYTGDEYDDFFPADVEGGSIDLCMRFEVFKLNNRMQEWECISELGDQVFLLGDDVIFCVSAKDFDGCKKNCLYVTMKYFGGNDDRIWGSFSEKMGLYDLVSRELVPFSLGNSYRKELGKFCWPLPSWLMMEAGSSEC